MLRFIAQSRDGSIAINVDKNKQPSINGADFEYSPQLLGIYNEVKDCIERNKLDLALEVLENSGFRIQVIEIPTNIEDPENPFVIRMNELWEDSEEAAITLQEEAKVNQDNFIDSFAIKIRLHKFIYDYQNSVLMKGLSDLDFEDFLNFQNEKRDIYRDLNIYVVSSFDLFLRLKNWFQNI
jgi:hypothetical protein